MAVCLLQKSREILSVPGKVRYSDVSEYRVRRSHYGVEQLSGVLGWFWRDRCMAEHPLGTVRWAALHVVRRDPCPPPFLSPLSSLSDMEADHQLPLFWAPGIQFLFQHDISVSFDLSEVLCSHFGLDATPPIHLSAQHGLSWQHSGAVGSSLGSFQLQLCPSCPCQRGSWHCCWRAVPVPGVSSG